MDNRGGEWLEWMKRTFFLYIVSRRETIFVPCLASRSLVPYFPSKSLITTEAQKMPKAAGR